ncbi:MAG TPA: 30S ribosomal protein S17 [Candidatus Omnitrophota bacterium]|nr:30S ribosomal protein S17 [Candidatus Omnitrophota bacterium]HPT07536.1 30S ribosomal protein S17 [Candidatus Omnitrophota bacterium]
MGIKKQFIGEVISDKMDKTIVVRVIRMAKHTLYNRVLKTATKFKVHDEKEVAHIGDEVKIEETRPLSKDKRFRLVSVVKKAQDTGIVLKDEVEK